MKEQERISRLREKGFSHTLSMKIARNVGRLNQANIQYSLGVMMIGDSIVAKGLNGGEISFTELEQMK